MKALGFQEELRGHSGCVNRLSWNDDGTFLASVSDDTNIILWPFPNGQPYRMPTLHTRNVLGVSFLPHSNSSALVTGGMDSCVSLHRISETDSYFDSLTRSDCWGAPRNDAHSLVAHTATFKCHTKSVNDIEVCQYEPNLAWSASSDGTVRQFDFRIPKSQQERPESSNVLIHAPNAGTSTGIGRWLGVSSVRVNSVRPEMLAIGIQSSSVLLFDRRKVGLTTMTANAHLSLRKHGIQNTEPMMILRYPFSLESNHRDWSNLDICPTYVSFGNRGDKVVATYSCGPAVTWSTLGSDIAQAKSLEPYFDISKSIGEVKFFGHENHVDITKSKKIIKMYKEGPNPYDGKDYSIRMLKRALAEDPYNYTIHQDLMDAYKRRISTFQDVFRTFVHTEYAVRFAPAYRFEPYFFLVMGLNMMHLHVAAFYLLQHMHRKFDGKSKEYYDTKSSQEFLKIKEEIEENVEAIYSAKDLKKLIQEAFIGEIDIDSWINRRRCKSEFPPDIPRAELAYINAWSISYREKGPTPIFTFGLLEPSFLQSYSYHSNRDTGIKEAVFFGPDDSYVICGSDTGNAIIYEAGSAEIAQVLRGDSEICNCMRPHPTMPIIATSGIDSTVKIWSPYWQGKERFAANGEKMLSVVSELEDVVRIGSIPPLFAGIGTVLHSPDIALMTLLEELGQIYGVTIEGEYSGEDPLNDDEYMDDNDETSQEYDIDEYGLNSSRGHWSDFPSPSLSSSSVSPDQSEHE